MTIDSCYEGVIADLTSQGKIKAISQKLLSLTTNSARVLYVYDILKNLKALQKPLKVDKTENVSIYYRNYGNRYYQNKDDYRAWQYYNLSLLYAPLTSESYCLALANRSAVFYALNKYSESLRDIKEVFSLKYPEKLKEKLFKRLKSCEDALANENKDREDNDYELLKDLSLQVPTDPRYPCASSKLEVVFSEEMGRHVIAREDIKVGEVLVEENPYFTLLLKSQYLFSCSYCLSRNCNLFPCTKCCFAMYCSEECNRNAWKDYHSVECSLMPSLVQLEFTKLELLALRTVIKARNDHSSWEDLFKTIEEAENRSNTEYRGHVKVNDQWVYDSKYYASIHTLASNIEKRSISDIFQKAVTSAVLLHFLKTTDFLKYVEDNKILECVAGLLLLHMMTSPTNMHGLSTNIQTADGNFTDEISLASAPYAYHSLLNHSCAPNVVRFSQLGTAEMTLYAIRPIKKGMQLFDNYGAHHALQDRKSRQESLRFQYKFTCICEACLNDWPTYLSMKLFLPLNFFSKNLPSDVLKQKQELLNNEVIEKLQEGDKGMAIKLFTPLCELIDKLDSYAPCIELSDCQESLKQCLVIFKGLLPYGYSKHVEWDAIPPKTD